MVKNLFLVSRFIFKFGELFFLSKVDVLFYSHHIYYSLNIEKNYYQNTFLSLFIDKLQSLGYHCLTVGRPYFTLDKKCVNENLCTINGIESRIFILSIFTNILHKIFKIKSDLILDLKVNIWIKIFRKTGAKLIIGIEPLKEVCIAARVCGVISVDIMHGFRDFNEFEGSYFTRLSYRGGGQDGWPDLMGCWDLNSCMILKENRGDYTVPFVLGHPAMIGRPRNNAKDNNSKILLFALQYKQRGSTDFHPIPQVLIDFIKARNDLKLWIRIHPLLMRMSPKHRKDVFSNLSKLFENCRNVDWEKPSNMSLFDALNESKVHLTVGSSSTLEAIQFGIPCGTFDDIDRHGKPFRRFFTHEFKSGDVTLLPMDSMSQLSSFVDSLESKEPTVVNESKNYTSEFIDHVVAFLNDNNNCLLKVYNNY